MVYFSQKMQVVKTARGSTRFTKTSWVIGVSWPMKPYWTLVFSEVQKAFAHDKPHTIWNLLEHWNTHFGPPNYNFPSFIVKTYGFGPWTEDLRLSGCPSISNAILRLGPLRNMWDFIILYLSSPSNSIAILRLGPLRNVWFHHFVI